MTRWFCVLLGLLAAPGCAVVDLGVTNPVPGLSRVAIAPFFNLSSEPAADGHRFAEAYFAELQKIPGFQVLPIGVTAAAIQDHRLDLQNAGDAVKLAEILGVDAVVVGAITDYNPYYPPRAGWQVAWYSAHPWAFSPGIPTEPFAREAILRADYVDDDDDCPPESRWKRWLWKLTRWTKRKSRDVKIENSTVFRGQSEPVFPPRPQLPEDDLEPPRPLIQPPAPAPSQDSAAPDPAKEMLLAPPPATEMPAMSLEPLMAYTRIFDGANAELTAALRDYLELRDDLRAGGWRSQLLRSEDFIRFTAHRMIVEMLALHGGESRRRVVFIWRKEK